MRKTADKPQLSDSLQNVSAGHLKTTEDIETKGSLRRGHSQDSLRRHNDKMHVPSGPGVERGALGKH